MGTRLGPALRAVYVAFNPDSEKAVLGVDSSAAMLLNRSGNRPLRRLINDEEKRTDNGEETS
jgi:hypothetical protein